MEGRGKNNEILLLEVFNYGKKIKPIRAITGQEKWNVMNKPNYPDPDQLVILTTAATFL